MKLGERIIGAVHPIDDRDASASMYIICALVSGAYVIPMYAVSGSRNDVTTVYKRSVAVFMSSLVSVGIVHAIVYDSCDLVAWIGLSTSMLKNLSIATRIFLSLFLGPLVQVASAWYQGNASLPYLDAPKHIVLRNLLIAPIAEELVFRSCICTLFLYCRASILHTVLISPLHFGAMHIHHIVDDMRHGGIGFQEALSRQILQVCYTWLFGCLAAFLYLRTGCLISACALHVACNWIGLPDLYGVIYGGKEMTPMRVVYAAGVCSFVVLMTMLSDGPYQHPLLVSKRVPV